VGKVKISFDKGETSKTYPLLDMKEHKSKWEKVEKCLMFMGTAIDLCYSRSLIDEEYKELKELYLFSYLLKEAHFDLTFQVFQNF